MNNYDIILKEHEKFYSQHISSTLSEIKEALSLMKIYHRLPNCFWEDIKHIHATNISTIWSLVNRWFDYKYPGTIGNDKPTISLLEWIYQNLKIANEN